MFFYGTLCHLPLLAQVLNRPAHSLDPRAAWLPGYASYLVAGESFPMICPDPDPDARAEGLVLDGLDDGALARLDYYEGGYGYGLDAVTVQTAGGPVRARMFGAPAQGLTRGAPWRLGAWQSDWAELTCLAAEEVMQGFPDRPPAQNARRYPMILARAAARQRAHAPGPASLRRATTPGDIEETGRTQPYANFFAVEEYDFRHRRFDGSMSAPMNRTAFLSGDAATVLPYDPRRDHVLLIEQFRVGPYARGDSECWSLEVIAGLVDPGERPQETARREALEEAGLTIEALYPIHGYYPSPGAKAEFIYSYLGLADLPDSAAGLGGLAAEGEDIRAHVVTFDRAMALLDSGEIQNAPVILSLMWLARHRERLRAAG
ncbi:MAG: NUDIX domain-containing protein [Rhodobacteraceae bacterium]|nr:NUDIX domain-containing protein [Paracoccaceae bacterium]